MAENKPSINVFFLLGCINSSLLVCQVWPSKKDLKLTYDLYLKAYSKDVSKELSFESVLKEMSDLKYIDETEDELVKFTKLGLLVAQDLAQKSEDRAKYN